MRFALDEINRSPTLLPNLTLGFQMYDSCTGLHQELDGTLKLLTGQRQGISNFSCKKMPPMSSIIGHVTSTFSILNAHILGLYRYPQKLCSYQNTDKTVNYKKLYSRSFCLLIHDAWEIDKMRTIKLDNGKSIARLGIRAHSAYCAHFPTSVSGSQLNSISATTYICGYADKLNSSQLNSSREDSSAVWNFFLYNCFAHVSVKDMFEQWKCWGKVHLTTDTWSAPQRLDIGKVAFLHGHGSLCRYPAAKQHARQPLGSWEFLHVTDVMLMSKQPYQHRWLDLRQRWKRITPAYKESDSTDRLNSSVSALQRSSSAAASCSTSTDRGRNMGLGSIYSVYMSSGVRLEAAVSEGTSVLPISIAANRHRPLRSILVLAVGAGGYLFTSIMKNHLWMPLSHYIQNVKVKLSTRRELFFDKNGDQPAIYDIINWHMNTDGTTRQVKVGSYDTTQANENRFLINTSALIWASGHKEVPVSVCTQSCLAGFRKVLRKDLPVCCFECVLCPLGEISNRTDSLNCFSCPWDEWPNSQKDRCFPKNKEFLSFEEPLGVTLASTSSFSSLLPISIFGLFMCYKNTPIVRANNFSLSCLLLMSMSLCFLSSLAFIGYPQPEKCLLRQVAFGTVFTLCVSCILAKTIMVVFAFMATKPGSVLRKWARPRVSYMIIAFSCILQLTLCMSWISFAPPFPTDNIHTKPGIIIVECNEGSPTAFWCMLGYLALLATISFIVAFFASRLPDSFNEAKFITFSMLAFLSVWVAYIPASLSSTGKYSVAMEVFAILSSSWALMTCMFAPKCFKILLRPEMNSKEHLMGKEFTKGVNQGGHKEENRRRLSKQHHHHHHHHHLHTVVPAAFMFVFLA
ncbi:extracellular calcium-sensing receptor-like [Pelobates cultripes]|uniref:Extracellular calcium-sensing receptor-like n=1 Tax=Pelobates cultripes TaxID=61616 RepID=A0AAD1RIP3_PELCU|nr:extracellular calcium-sensing receptor-like [Pelobates cultripes]